MIIIIYIYIYIYRLCRESKQRTPSAAKHFNKRFALRASSVLSDGDIQLPAAPVSPYFHFAPEKRERKGTTFKSSLLNNT